MFCLIIAEAISESKAIICLNIFCLDYLSWKFINQMNASKDRAIFVIELYGKQENTVKL